MITRKAFLEKGNDLAIKSFPLPEVYGKDVELRLRTWSGGVRSAFEKKWAERKASDNPGRFRFDVIQKTLVDENDKPLLKEDDFEAVMKKLAPLIEDLFDACCGLSGLRAEDVKELEGNSESGPSSDSSSGSASVELVEPSIPTSCGGD